MTDHEKFRPGLLTAGDAILVKPDADGNLHPAKTATSSEVARVTGKPRKVRPDDPDKRTGYRVTTSKGVIPFVGALARIMKAEPDDIKRQAHRDRRDADRRVAATEAQGTLDGVVMSPPEPPPPAPRERWSPPVDEDDEAIRAFRVQIDAATTDVARAYWEHRVTLRASGLRG